MESSVVVQGPVASSCGHGNEHCVSMNTGDILIGSGTVNFSRMIPLCEISFGVFIYRYFFGVPLEYSSAM